MARAVTLEQAAAALRPGMTVFVSGSMAEPRTLAELLDRPAVARGLHVVETRLPGFRTATYAGCDCTVTTFFLPPELHDHARAGRVRLLPLHYRDTFDVLARLAVDVLLLELAPPDHRGWCSLGLACDFVPAVLPHARLVIAEINHALPSPPGAPRVPLERCDLTVDSERAPRTAAPSAASEETRAIARHVAALVRDGDCVQTGLGALPDAILLALADKNDLRFHSGLFGDGAHRLAESGVFAERTPLTAGIAFGSAALYRWLADSERVDFRSVDHTHDPRTIAALENFVAVNSAIEVDLFGQVNVDTIGGRPISGVGGAVDFMRGAARSRGGRSIIALPATARAGASSRIVAALPPGTPASATRADVDWVVTEHGAAHLRAHSVRERAELLCEIAAPQFRDELRAAAGALPSG